MAHILIIEDDPTIRSILRRILIRGEHVVGEAENGPTAIVAFKEHQPDVVLTDINMPDMDGIEVMKELRAIDSSVPVIAISGGGLFPAELLLSNASALGAVAMITKPFDAQQLLDVVDGVLAVPL